MTQRNIIALIAIVVLLGIGAVVYLQRNASAPDATQANDYKSSFVDNCLKQANAAAMQQGTALNEEQKRVYQQICGCVADRTLKQFSQAQLSQLSQNLNDPATIGQLKEFLQSCAAETKMPATNP